MEGEVLVAYAWEATDEDKAAIEQRYLLMQVDIIRAIGVYHYRIQGISSVEEIVSALKEEPLVRMVEPNYLHQTQAFYPPDDPHFNYMWHLENTGQVVNGWQAVEGFDIDWLRSMEIYTPEQPAVVAILDSGIALDHPEFYDEHGDKTSLWINQAEWYGNDYRDDDGNGYVDDILGWDFFDHDWNPWDEHGHGTLCASIIGGLSNNGIPGLGVCPDVELMALRVGNDLGAVSTSAWISAMEYAAQNGARIVNCSFGGFNYSNSGQAMVDWLGKQNILIVCAAGNFAANNDTTKYYPACYSGTHLMSIASVDPMGNLSYFSNYGESTVDLAAPGSSIYGAGLSRSDSFLEDFDGSVDGWTTYPMNDNYSSFENWALFEYQAGNFALADSVGHGGILAYYEGWTHTVAESPMLDLRGLTGPLLEFDIAYQLEGQWLIFDTDLLFIEASTNGYNWELVDVIYGAGANAQLRHERIDLSPFQNGQIFIRFRLKTDLFSNYYGVYIDNFRITAVRTFDYTGQEHQFNDGTSFAAPVVSGVAALLLAQRPELKASDLSLLLLLSAYLDAHPSLEGRLATEGIVNAYNALMLSSDYSMAMWRFYTESVEYSETFRNHPWMGYIHFGEMVVFSDWFYQFPLGFAFVVYETDTSTYFYSPDYGWFWISEECSPYLYSLENREWYGSGM